MTSSPRPHTVLVAHPGAELFGSDRMLLESVAGMRDAGFDVVVALPDAGPLVEHLSATGARVVVTSMLVLRKALLRPRGWSRLFRDLFRGTGCAWRLITRVDPDAVYISTLTLPAWPIIARARGRRTVSHAHEAEASAHRIVNAVLYSPLLCAHRVLVNSRFSLRTMLSSFPSLDGRATVVPNGVAGPERPAPARPELTEGLRVAYVGRLSPRKGPDVVLRAAQRLGRSGDPVHVELIGSTFPGYEWYERELRELAASDTAVHVSFTGFVADVWPRIAAADVLVVPSRIDEPFGNTAVEGVLAGRPVVASDTSGLREAAGGYTTTRLVTPDDPAALAVALTELAADWPQIVTDLPAQAARAADRHAPRRYREAIARAVSPEG